MSSLLTEVSGPSTSSSPSARARILKSGRSRNARTGGSSANSITSNDTIGDRSSVGLGPAHDAQEAESNSQGTKVGVEIAKIKSLLPSKRRKERKLRESTAQLDDKVLHQGEIGENNDNTRKKAVTAVVESRDSSEYAKSDGSSLLTEDSDTEGHPAKPSLSPHDSHSGYLTHTSPLIPTEALDGNFSTSKASASSAVGEEMLKDGKRSQRQRHVMPDGGDAAPSLFSTSYSRKPRDTSRVHENITGDIGDRGNLAVPSGRENSTSPAREAAPPSQSDVRAQPNKVARFRESSAIEETPTTLITPPTPTEPQTARLKSGKGLERSPEDYGRNSPNRGQFGAQSGKSSSLVHRKTRSAASNNGKAMTMPLTPHIEETRTPGGTLSNPLAPPTSFFSSVFSAAQNAASQLSNIANTSGSPSTKSKSTSSDIRRTGGPNMVDGDEIMESNAKKNRLTEGLEERERKLAIDTLGTGDLTLNHLGISDASSNPSPYTSAFDFSSSVQTSEVEQTTENRAAARAVSAAYSEKPNSEKSLPVDRSKSVEPQPGGQTPPRSQTEPEASIKRSGSIRSRISAGRRRRNRGNSVTTSIGTTNQGLSSSSATLLNLHSTATRTRHTGFAAAASKRNREFHQVFKSVPEEDYLIDDYSAALQKEILLHGRMYVSEGHICFSSNILGWVTNLVISFDEIVSVEKKSTAVIFPNAIIIQTLHARNVFASFLSRDTTYELIISIWKSGHSNLKSSLNGVMVEGNATGDKTMKAESINSEGVSEEGTEDEIYDEDVEEDESVIHNDASEFTLAANDTAISDQPMSRQVSGAGLGINANATTAVKLADATEALVAGTLATSDYPGPGTHAPTDCGDSESHFEKFIMDTTIPAPLGKIYSLMFGPSSNTFMRKWLMEEQKCTEVQLDERGLDSESRANNLSYIKPLYASIGPKQTRCITAQRMDRFDLENAVIVECSTQNPDVPSGHVFVVKTRYCLMWGPANATRLITTCVVEWTGKSWLKGPIEKGANEGQTQYARDLTTALRNAVTKPSRGIALNTKAGKGKSKKRAAESTEQPAEDLLVGEDTVARYDTTSYSFKSIIQPISRMLMDTAASAPVAVILILVLLSWALSWSFGRNSHWNQHQVNKLGFARFPSAARIAAYEEMWRTEQSELWSWLEDRAGIAQAVGNQYNNEDDRKALPRSWDRAAQRQLSDERLDVQQIEEALRVTEERMSALKVLIEKKKAEQSKKVPKL